MTRKAVRRAKNAALAKEDAGNRCAVCQRNLFEVSMIVEDLLVQGRCCSDECLAELIRRSTA